MGGYRLGGILDEEDKRSQVVFGGHLATDTLLCYGPKVGMYHEKRTCLLHFRSVRAFQIEYVRLTIPNLISSKVGGCAVPSIPSQHGAHL